MADTLIAPIPMRSPLVDKDTPGLAMRAWSAWWNRVAEVVGDLAARLLGVEAITIDVTPGTAAAGKAVVVDDALDVTGLGRVGVDVVAWDDIELVRDEAEVVALKAGLNPATLRIYLDDEDYSSFGYDTEILGSLTARGEIVSGTSPAVTGDVRLSNLGSVRGRNRVEGGDLDLIELMDLTSTQDAIKFGDGNAVWIGKTNGQAPTSFSNGYFWVEYTASSAALKVRVGGVTRTLTFISF